MVITLSREDINSANLVADARHRESLINERVPTFNKRLGNELESHRIGCQGQLAVARALKLEWNGYVGKFRYVAHVQPDIWVRVVRTGGMPIKYWAKPGQRHVMVRHVTGGTFNILGWALTEDGKKYPNLNLGGYGSARFIPKHDLRPMEAI